MHWLQIIIITPVHLSILTLHYPSKSCRLLTILKKYIQSAYNAGTAKAICSMSSDSGVIVLDMHTAYLFLPNFFLKCSKMRWYVTRGLHFLFTWASNKRKIQKSVQKEMEREIEHLAKMMHPDWSGNTLFSCVLFSFYIKCFFVYDCVYCVMYGLNFGPVTWILA